MRWPSRASRQRSLLETRPPFRLTCAGDVLRGRNLFGIPLNLIVVGVFLSISKLGLAGALTCSSAALFCAALAQLALRRVAA